MRIGEFASYFDVTKSLVRYYIKEGLIVPDVLNKQYQFSDNCVWDMEMIMQLKEMRVSLKSILELLSIWRITHLASEEDYKKYEAVFSAHVAKQEKALDEVEKKIKALEEFIDALSVPRTDSC